MRRFHIPKSGTCGTILRDWQPLVYFPEVWNHRDEFRYLQYGTCLSNYSLPELIYCEIRHKLTQPLVKYITILTAQHKVTNRASLRNELSELHSLCLRVIATFNKPCGTPYLFKRKACVCKRDHHSIRILCMVLSGCVRGIGNAIFFSLSVLNTWYLHMKGVSGGHRHLNWTATPQWSLGKHCSVSSLFCPMSLKKTGVKWAGSEWRT